MVWFFERESKKLRLRDEGNDRGDDVLIKVVTILNVGFDRSELCRSLPLAFRNSWMFTVFILGSAIAGFPHRNINGRNLNNFYLSISYCLTHLVSIMGRDLYKQRDSLLNEPKNKLTCCYAKGKRDLRPNETLRDDANFHSRHFDRETVSKRSGQIKITN
ncbi:hypothetical protein DPMN_156407 [Dreissena polymorpha]|uniref:Uncharacterized protein n=1 Tax=Dreissena polymorpha TaxID=45954 RepID=A0A9D4FVL8_DREPO|nr:hypothetical protein DPMN_156407 [Dreissena polymorpha]